MYEGVTVLRVEFRNFKAFSQYSITLSEFNILVGPNNSGKSTILNAFRVLAAGIRRANAKNPEVVEGPTNVTYGYIVPTEDLPISLENAHTDFREDTPTTISFHLSNGNKLILFFPNEGRTVMIAEARRAVRFTKVFREEFPLRIESVPVLGPVEHKEALVEQRTVQRGLVTHRASRHFRNYWYHFPEDFMAFAEAIKSSWADMEIKPPELMNYEILAMFCREGRIEKELFWAGFGFQVWCQLLTHVVRSRNAGLLIIDEPEIYLHPDLQRRLVSILRDAGPNILLATHSTELISEAEPSDISIIDKTRKSALRLRSIDHVQNAMNLLGSSQNVALTQLARTQRVLAVEGNDFQIISRVAHQAGFPELASKYDFTVIPMGGFSSWPNLKALASGIEAALGKPIRLAAVFDRDFRCDEEIESIEAILAEHTSLVHFHKRKELENYLLVPSVLERAVKLKLSNVVSSTTPMGAQFLVRDVLDEITCPMKDNLLAQYIDARVQYFRSSGKHKTVITTEAIGRFNEKWDDIDSRMQIVPGKETFSQFNKYLNDNYKISLTPTAVISRFKSEEIPSDLMLLLRKIEKFRKNP